MYIGVDLGTSLTKAAAFDENGRLLGTWSEPTRLLRPRPGWYEQDLDETVRSVASVVRGVRATVESSSASSSSASSSSLSPSPAQPAGSAVRLVALTGQGDGVWLTTPDGVAVRPAISWMDARATPIVRRWEHEGIVETLFRRNGGVIFPGCPAPILAWLAENEPESLERAGTAGYCKDAVLQRLTGERATDATDASLPFLDQHTRTYDPELLALCGLADRADLLAPITEPVPAGGLTPAAAELCGLPSGTPVTAGPFDLPASAAGSGIDAIGDGHVIVGTTLACQVLTGDPAAAGEPAGLTIALPPAGPDGPDGPDGPAGPAGPDGLDGPAGPAGPRWLRAMPTMVGTGALDWVLELIGEPHERVDELIAASRPGAGGIACLPYFSASGERAPFIHTGARARLDGMTVDTSKADLVRAVCEAIAHAGRHCLDEAGLDATGAVAVCGGGARSTAWMRILAGILRRPVRVSAQAEVGAWGAVLAGAAALGLDVTGTAARAADVVVAPDPGEADEYAERHDRYLADLHRARAEWS